MIILDTNVLSEPLRPTPDGVAVRWLDAQEPGTLFITAITVAELHCGVELLPAGKRKKALKSALTDEVLPLFGDRVLAFDAQAAVAFGKLHAVRRAAGAPISFADCAIAAIAQLHGFALATRNQRDFEHLPIKLIDPWVGP
jgi:hypothetical protein